LYGGCTDIQSIPRIWGITPPWLLDERQQDVFGVNLVVPVALDDLRSALSSLLRPLGKTVESHHNFSSSGQ
jgi:hypothetical protein